MCLVGFAHFYSEPRRFLCGGVRRGKNIGRFFPLSSLFPSVLAPFFSPFSPAVVPMHPTFSTNWNSILGRWLSNYHKIVINIRHETQIKFLSVSLSLTLAHYSSCIIQLKQFYFLLIAAKNLDKIMIQLKLG